MLGLGVCVILNYIHVMQKNSHCVFSTCTVMCLVVLFFHVHMYLYRLFSYHVHVNYNNYCVQHYHSLSVHVRIYERNLTELPELVYSDSES